jgi:hypothetical protein
MTTKTRTPTPFPTRDNGHHDYFEDDEILVFCNHGDDIWVGFMKHGKGGLEFLTSGKNATKVLDETRSLQRKAIKQGK